MASIYHGFIEQYHSVEGLMKAKFQRDFPYHNVEDFNAWFQHDSEFESREMGAERLSYPQKQYLKEKKTWGRFWQDDQFPGRKPLALTERARLNRASIQHPFPYRGRRRGRGRGFARGQDGGSIRGRGHGRGSPPATYRESCGFINTSRPDSTSNQSMTTSNTITCRNCGHQSHPEIFCQYRATSNQTLHRDRHLTCGKYGHKEFAFGDKCEACVRNLRHRIRAGARERAEEGLLIDVSVPDENGVGGGESAAEGVDPLVGMMGGNLLNGEGNTQGPRFGNGTGAGEGILVSVGVPDGNEAEEDGTVWMMAATSLNGQGNTQSLRSPIVIGAGEGTEEGFLIDISIPDGNGVGDGESHTKNVEEDANAGLMNGTSLNEIRRENVVEADENGANEGWNRDREGVLIDVGVPDWEITEEEEDALVEMSGESTLNGNGLGNVSEGEGEGSDGWNGEVLIEF